jgi:O-antigen/teichoic acid export membrane protein
VRLSRHAARSLAFASATSGSGVLLLLLLIVAGRLLGDERYGQFSFALALATIVETLVDFGLKEVATRSIARDRSIAARLVANTFGLKIALGASALALLAVVTFALRPETDVRAACLLLGASSVVRSYLMTLRHTLNGLERFGLESAVVVADRAFLLVFGVVALTGGFGLVGLAIAFVAGRGLAFALAYAITRRQVGALGLGFDVVYWRDLQRTALPFGLFIAVLSLYSYVDTLMLSVMRSDQETGLYNAAYRLYEGLINLPVVIATVVGPKLSRYFVSDPERHLRLARWSVGGAFAIAVPAAVATAWLAPWLITTLFGQPYLPAAPVLLVLGLGFVFVFPLQLMHSVAISVNEERLLLRAGLVGLVANVGLNLFLIPAYGMHGAAIATVVSEGASLALLVYGVVSRR